MRLSGRAFTRLHDFDVPLASAADTKLPLPGPPKEIVITELKRRLAADPDTKLLWDKFLNNQFCKTGYITKAEDFNHKYQAYSKQDYLYLIEYVRMVTYRDLHGPTGALTEDNLVTIALNMTKHVHSDVTTFARACFDMNITPQELYKEHLWKTVADYASWEQQNILTDDLFFDYIKMAPCLYGWNKIALNLKGSPNPVEHTYFFDYWFKPNSSDDATKYADDFSNSLDKLKPIAPTEDDWKKWTEAFRQACLFEIAFFDAALAVVKVGAKNI